MSRLIRGRERATWYASPSDKIVWSIEKRPDSTIVDLTMTLVICNGGNKGRTMLTQVSIFTANENRDGILYQISEAARLMVLYRNLNERKFHHTITWSFHDYKFRNGNQTSIRASDARAIRGLS